MKKQVLGGRTMKSKVDKQLLLENMLELDKGSEKRGGFHAN